MKKVLCFRKLLFLGFILLCFSYIILLYITPHAIIVNKTKHILYIRSMQYIVTDEEPTIAEVEQMKYIIPIQPGEKRELSFNFFSLFSADLMRVHMSWSIGSQASSETTASGGHAFDSYRCKGVCQIEIDVYEDSYKIIPEATFYCYKKLTPIKGTMIIHTAEKSIFNYYGSSTDKIEKQIIRMN